MHTAAVINSSNITELIQRTLNYVDPRLVHHGSRVAHLVYRMMEVDGGFPAEEQQDIYFLALLHDIGAYKTEEINEMVSFEAHAIWEHSIYGYLFLSYFSPLSRYAEAILFHHVAANALGQLDPHIARISQFINLADRVDIFWVHKPDADAVKQYLRKHMGDRFQCDVVELFFHTLQKYDLLEEWQHPQQIAQPPITLSAKGCSQYLDMLIFAIDFRSTHTVTHTIMTSQLSKGLAKALGLREEQIHNIYYSALLHDLGKIGIPVEILEYPGKLSNQAWNIMQTHVQITEDILKGLVHPRIVQTAIRHHEKLDGSGYPNALKESDLCIEDQVVAIADMTSALLGSRSYKAAYSKEKTIEILTKQAEDGKISPQITEVLQCQFDEIVAEVKEKCLPVLTQYSGMRKEYDEKLAMFMNQKIYQPA